MDETRVRKKTKGSGQFFVVLSANETLDLPGSIYRSTNLLNSTQYAREELHDDNTEPTNTITPSVDMKLLSPYHRHWNNAGGHDMQM